MAEQSFFGLENDHPGDLPDFFKDGGVGGDLLEAALEGKSSACESVCSHCTYR